MKSFYMFADDLEYQFDWESSDHYSDFSYVEKHISMDTVLNLEVGELVQGTNYSIIRLKDV